MMESTNRTLEFGFEFQLYCIGARYPCENYFPTLGLTFLITEIGMLVGSTSYGLTINRYDGFGMMPTRKMVNVLFAT
jgi:hypothetical protein